MFDSYNSGTVLDSNNSVTMLDSHNSGTELDSYISGTMLDLPHYHCNSVYVPWQTKDQRKEMTMRTNYGRSLFHPSPAIAPPADSIVL